MSGKFRKESEKVLMGWVWVLGFGLIPHLLLYFLPINKIPGLISGCVYNFGVALITTRSLYIGVVTIANTPDDRWVLAYTIMSIIFLVLGVMLYATGLAMDKFMPKEEEKDQ